MITECKYGRYVCMFWALDDFIRCKGINAVLGSGSRSVFKACKETRLKEFQSFIRIYRIVMV